MTAAIATRETFESLRREDPVGEWWSARDLMFPLGYDRWERFEDAINRAEASASHLGEDARDHFRSAAKKVEIGSGAMRVIADYRLTRFGVYLVAMNGDPRKPEIAAAQTYFAVQTRIAETRPDVTAIDRKTLARWLIEAEEAKELAEARVAELAPMAAVAEDLVASSGDYSTDTAAKILCRAGIDTGKHKLFVQLRRLGWTIDNYTPYQAHINNGRLAVRASRYWHEPTREFRVRQQIRITPKGLAALHKLLGGSQPLELVRGVS
jgi:DNA-damage-inducible protein D